VRRHCSKAARPGGQARWPGAPGEAIRHLLTATQAQAVIAAAIRRHLHAVITTGRRWDPAIATHGTKHPAVMPIAA
jgi:hypothetical protein